ncbi:MAG: sigma-70 family RNA polymerase sigma factor, partial [Flavobacteriales bacterium]|nr:sigma-70 family RNA polymerase sigma factor [Flavobacteriales bacterium]
IPHLFRSEFSKIVSVLCKTFGLSNIQLAEDIVSDTLLKATETWGLKGIPENPIAWLYKVAKNLTLDYFKREKISIEKITPEFKNQHSNITEFEIDLSENNIEDSQLQMLFAVCNPAISKEAQITFALRVLCGFGIKEISNALLTNKATINKRLQRTKEVFRANETYLHFPTEKELTLRLNNLLSILYLLFNEGYYSSSSERTIQKELCVEAMRLLYMLLNYKPTNQSKTNALMALFCFQASRFDARVDQKGASILYEKQDKNKWDFELIKKGEYYVNESANDEVTKYHLEAFIAFWHTRTDANENEKWENILQFYNKLIQIEYSPITALNRTYALAKANGKKEALKEALKIDLKDNHFYHTLIAEFYIGVNRTKQIEHLQLALKLADTGNDKQIISEKLKIASSQK